MAFVLKCRKCAKLLIDCEISPVFTGHGLKMEKGTFYHTPPELDCRGQMDSIYLKEVALPEWILASIYEEDWQKGRLRCPNCSSRIGSFDFVSGRKCNCNKFILLPIHLIKSKVDYKEQLNNQENTKLL